MSALLASKTHTQEEQAIEERIRTLSQVIVAATCVAAALYVLRSILIPLTLAVALKYLLMPIVRMLSERPLHCCGVTWCDRPPRCAHGRPAWVRSVVTCVAHARLPYGIAVLVALGAAFAGLATIGFIVAESVQRFAHRAPLYSERVQELAALFVGWADRMQASFTLFNTTVAHDGADGVPANVTADAALAAQLATTERLASLVGHVPVADFIVQALEALLEAISNLFIVMLFTIYLLLTPATAARTSATAPNGLPLAATTARREKEAREDAEADRQVNAYIRGKVAVSLLVGAVTGASLGAVGVDLWLVFGVLAFWLNFIPTVGTVVAVALPMPIVLLDPTFSNGAAAVAFAVPLAAHTFAGNVLEPLLFGQTLKLHPVVVLLSLLLWGSLWGVTGMVLAVPLTAVMRIRCAATPHPMPQYVAALLAGGQASDQADGSSTSEEADEQLQMMELPPAKPLA